MLKKTIKYTSLFLMLGVISACANVKKEPADDGYESRQSYGGDGWGEKTQKEEDRFLNKQISKVLGGKKRSSKKDDEIRARLERLENQQNGNVQVQPATTNSSDITAPPIGSTRTSPNVGSSWQNSASYQEWKRAKEGGSSDYQEFQEYKEWLEFKKLKEQNK